MLPLYEIPFRQRRNVLSFSKRWFPEYQRQDINVNQVNWITLKKIITKRNVYYKFATAWFIKMCNWQLFQIKTTFSLRKCHTVYYTDCNILTVWAGYLNQV